MHRPRLAIAVITAILFASGCGDSPFGPASIAGHYRLESVDGRSVPTSTGPCSGCVQVVIRHGDLVMRANRTFELGYVILQSGTFRLDGDRLHLTIPPFEPGAAPWEMTGFAAGDSIVIDTGDEQATVRLLFRRAPRNRVAVSPGIYTLAAVNGRGEPLITFDRVTESGRYTARVVFDSLVFLDAVFYRRHREVESLLYLPGGGILSSGSSTHTSGSYGGGEDKVILRPYLLIDDTPASDTLSIDGNSLMRRTELVASTLEERYDRR